MSRYATWPARWSHWAGFGARAGSPQYRAAVMTRSEWVGEAFVRFTGSGLGSADRALQTSLQRAIVGAAGLAALLALATGLTVARRITCPVEQIIAVTRAVGRGERFPGHPIAGLEAWLWTPEFDQHRSRHRAELTHRPGLPINRTHPVRQPGWPKMGNCALGPLHRQTCGVNGHLAAGLAFSGVSPCGRRNRRRARVRGRDRAAGGPGWHERRALARCLGRGRYESCCAQSHAAACQIASGRDPVGARQGRAERPSPPATRR